MPNILDIYVFAFLLILRCPQLIRLISMTTDQKHNKSIILNLSSQRNDDLIWFDFRTNHRSHMNSFNWNWPIDFSWEIWYVKRFCTITTKWYFHIIWPWTKNERYSFIPTIKISLITCFNYLIKIKEQLIMFFSDLMDRGQAIPYVFKYSMYEYQTLKSYILRFFLYKTLCRCEKRNRLQFSINMAPFQFRYV